MDDGAGVLRGLSDEEVLALAPVAGGAAFGSADGVEGADSVDEDGASGDEGADSDDEDAGFAAALESFR